MKTEMNQPLANTLLKKARKGLSSRSGRVAAGAQIEPASARQTYRGSAVGDAHPDKKRALRRAPRN